MVKTMKPTVLTTDDMEMDLARRALQMRRDGKTLYEISYALHLSEHRANTLMRNALKLATAAVGMAEKRELIELEIQRLDALQNAVWAKAMKGDTRSVDAAVKIINARSKLLGLENVETGAVHTVVIAGDSSAYIQALESVRQHGELET